MSDRTLLVWGDVGAGKSSLLAAALLGPRADKLLPMVDWRASLPAVQVGLQEHWRRLTGNLPTAPTSGIPPGVRVQFHGGGGVVFQDMMGEDARRPEGADTQRLLDAADGVLFIQGWTGTGLRWGVLQGAAPALADPDPARRRPAVLAFTKCEQGLDPGHPAWRNWETPGRAGRPWWEDVFRAPRDAEFLARMDAVCPTSVYGFRAEYGAFNPACLLDEFGEVIPYDIHPVNATEAIAWFLRRWAP